MSEAQKRAYLIADNKLAENAGWDEALLAQEFKYLGSLELDFDLSITGFEIPEIDFLLGLNDSDLESGEHDVVPPPPVNVVTQEGDLWIIGNHRIFCGNILNPDHVDFLMNGDTARMIFTDPPYNVAIQGHVTGKGKTQHQEFAMASGEMSEKEFMIFLEETFAQLKRVSSNGSIHYVCMDWRHIHEIICAGKAIYQDFLNLCVWNKNNGGMGSFYRSKHELVFVFKNGTKPHINNVQLGQYGRYRTNVWDYAGVNTFKEGRDEELSMHPTVKPVSMVADAILDGSNPKDIILDGFGGSGTTMIAAELKDRRAYLMEIDPRYVDVMLMRYMTEFGEEPVKKMDLNLVNSKDRKECNTCLRAMNMKWGIGSHPKRLNLKKGNLETPWVGKKVRKVSGKSFWRSSKEWL